MGFRFVFLSNQKRFVSRRFRIPVRLFRLKILDGFDHYSIASIDLLAGLV
jgi:hypothetical protein